MTGYIILIIVAIIAILALIFYSNYIKLKTYKDKMDKAEMIIETNLSKKLEIIIEINSVVKKLIGKKDYLKEFTDIENLIMTNIEKDWKLNDAEKLINDLSLDVKELNKDKKFNDLLKQIREIDELLISAKNIFNSNAFQSNQLIKTFPNNIIAKIANLRIRSYYNKNNPEDNDNF